MEVKEEELLSDFQKLLAGDSCVATHVLYDEEVDKGPLPSPKLLKDMLQEMEASQVSPSKYMTGIQELYTDQYVSHVEEATRGQSDNPRWFRQREGRITASLFGAAARYSKDKANNYIVRKVLGVRPSSLQSTLSTGSSLNQWHVSSTLNRN